MITPMIDWVTCVIPLVHRPIKTGQFISFDQDGAVEFVKPKYQRVEGSYSSSVIVKSQGELDKEGNATELYFDGNPSKFVQGHNVFGVLDLKQLLHGVFRKLHKSSAIDFELFSLFSCLDSAKVVRLDVTNSIQFSNQNEVRAYIKQLSQFAHTRNGRPQQKQWRLLFSGGSRRWSISVYSKGDEVTKRSFSSDFDHRDFIVSEASRLCRVEVRFLSMELLKNGLNKIYRITPEKLTSLYSDYVSRITMSEKIELSSDELTALPKTVRHTYLLWKSGLSVQAEMSTPTFYRHRAALMKAGVDISVPYDPAVTGEIVPLKRVVEAVPYQIPQEARDRGLVYEYEAPKLRLISN